MDRDWQGLASAIRASREVNGLTRQQLADKARVSLGSIKNLESGQGFKRLPPTLEPVEQALEWTPGTALRKLHRQEIEAPQGVSHEGRFVREPISDVNEFVRDVVREITLVVAPDTPLSEIVRLEGLVIEIARQHGWPEPPLVTFQQESEDA